MTAPIGLQLYTLRESLAKDYQAGIRQVAQAGYVGVEPAGFPGSTAQEAGKLFTELGLIVPTAHTPLAVGDDKNKIIDDLGHINCSCSITGKGPDDFATTDKIKAACAQFNQAWDFLKSHNIRFALHNHWWEFQPVDGKLVYETMLEELAPEILFEIDTYWVKTGGCNPVDVIKQLGSRAPFLHIKDGPCKQGEPMTAVGQGIMDFPAIAQVSADTAQWFIVELDACATDMMTAVKESYQYLTAEKLARGNV